MADQHFRLAIVMGRQRPAATHVKYATREAAEKAMRWHEARRPGLRFAVVRIEPPHR